MGNPQKKAAPRKSRRTVSTEVAERPPLQIVRDEPEPVKAPVRRRLDYSMKGLIGLIREVKVVVEALEIIWGASKDNQKLLRSLISFAENIGIRAKHKHGVNYETLRRTVNFANKVREALEVEFRLTVDGWEGRQANTFDSIRAIDSSILDESAGQIAEVQAELRRVTEGEMSFRTIAEAYRRALNLMGKLRKKANLAEEVQRRSQRLDEQAEQADELFAEIDDLKALLD